MRLADRTRHLTPFKVVDFIQAAVELQAQGRDIVRMAIGEPGFATAGPIVESAKQALAEGKTFYTPPCGIPELRQAIADYYQQRYGLTIDPQRIIVTTGSSAALGMICDLLLNPSDGLLMSDPGYPCNPNFVRRLDAEPQFVPVDPSGNYQLTAELVASHWQDNTVGVMVASPSNPTGEIISRDNLAALYREVSDRGGNLIVDEIYHGLTYGNEPVASILEITDGAFVVNSFSKYFNMTGWRLGWLVVPEGWTEMADRLSQNMFLAAPTLAQYAALRALQPDMLAIFDQQVATFKERRDTLLQGLARLELEPAAAPEGAFYVYVDVSKYTQDSVAFCLKIVEETGVVLTPGLDFDHNGGCYVRFAYTCDVARIDEAIERLAAWLG